MKRIVRILLHGAAAVSLLLFIGAVALWMMSYRSEYDLYRTVDRGRQQIGVSRGEVYLLSAWQGDDSASARYGPSEWKLGEGPASDEFYAEVARHSPNERPVAGFFFGRSEANGLRQTELLIPIWLLAALLALLPVLDLMRYRKRRREALRRKMGRCRRCGYDLRATPERCPECGAVPTAKPSRPGGAGG
jgi:hypothetical protein